MTKAHFTVFAHIMSSPAIGFHQSRLI